MSKTKKPTRIQIGSGYLVTPRQHCNTEVVIQNIDDEFKIVSSDQSYTIEATKFHHVTRKNPMQNTKVETFILQDYQGNELTVILRELWNMDEFSEIVTDLWNRDTSCKKDVRDAQGFCVVQRRSEYWNNADCYVRAFGIRKTDPLCQIPFMLDVLYDVVNITFDRGFSSMGVARSGASMDIPHFGILLKDVFAAMSELDFSESMQTDIYHYIAQYFAKPIVKKTPWNKGYCYNPDPDGYDEEA